MNHQAQGNPSKTSSSRNIGIAFFLNLIFTIAELIGGYLTNSVAILSDALHDLGDIFGLGTAWYLDKTSKKARTDRFTYGFKRFSLLGALINSLILISGSILILLEAIPRIMEPQVSNAQGMFIFAIAGILINGFAALKVRKGKTMNERIVTWHLLEDVLGWVGILVISVIMIFYNLPILDPILSVIITLYILWNVIKNLKKTIMIFLQGVPESIHISDLEKNMMKIPKVKAVHDTHVWSLDGVHHILTTHVVVDENSNADDALHAKCQVKQCIAKQFGIGHATVEIEFEHEKCDLIECFPID